MNRIAVCCVALLLCSSAWAKESKLTVYKSKDANGVTVYSQFEVPTSKPVTVVVSSTANDAAPNPDNSSETASGAAPPEPSSAQGICSQALKNIEMLSSGNPLKHDTGSGSEDMSPEDIAAAKDIAEKNVALYCKSRSK